jgi:PAS domain-containing protein
VYCCAAPVVGEDGTVAGSIGAFVDITGRRKAAAALRASEERLRLAMDAARLDSWEWDLRTGVVQWSSGSERFLAPSPGRQETVHETFLGMVHPDDREAVQHTLARALSTGEPCDLQIRRISGGVERWGEVKGKVLPTRPAIRRA